MSEFASWPASKLQKAIDAAHRVSMAHVDAMILAGRGNETFRDIEKKDDHASRLYVEAFAYDRALNAELERRMKHQGNAKPIRQNNPSARGSKMATAKQIAARKAFSKIMKSGGFPKKNPISGKSGRTSPSKRTNASRNHAMVKRLGNPKKRIPAASRAINPASRKPTSYGVMIVASNGTAKPYAWFKDKAKAVEYAQAKADQSGYSFQVKPLYSK